MHLYQKWQKYAFAYVHMQMHNYPKPSYNQIMRSLKNLITFWVNLNHSRSKQHFLGCWVISKNCLMSKTNMTCQGKKVTIAGKIGRNYS